MRAMKVLAAALLAFAAPLAAQPPGSDPVLVAKERRVTPHVWAIDGYPHVFIVTGSTGTLVIDTGMGTPNGRFVAAAAQRVARGGKLYLAVTHEHPEHAAGFGGFPAGTVLIRSRAQAGDVAANATQMIERFKGRGPDWAKLLQGATLGTPSVAFDRAYRLNLGDVHVRLLQVPPAHTDGDVLLFIEEDGALATGDIIQAKSVPNPTGSGTIAGWLGAIEMGAALKPRVILPTHTAEGGAELIDVNRDMLRDVQAKAAAANRAGRDAAALESELRVSYGGWQNPQNLRNLATRALAEAR